MANGKVHLANVLAVEIACSRLRENEHVGGGPTAEVFSVPKFQTLLYALALRSR